MAKAKSAALSFADKCRSVLAANWEARLNTVKSDAKGSKGIHTSRVHYMVHKATPYLLIPESDMHNVNIMLDGRGSLSVWSPIPGSLKRFLKSIDKLSPRVALTGDLLPLRENKVPIVTDKLKEAMLKEHKAATEASYAVSAILSSASPTCRTRSEGLLSILNEDSSYEIYKFEVGSCTYVDASGGRHNFDDLDHFEGAKADMLLPLSVKLIDGVNQSETRRRALIIFCFEYFNVTARDALMISIDRHGFDVLAKVPERENTGNMPQEYHWKEFRFTFKEAAKDVEDFCRMLVELEAEAVQSVKSYSGLG